MHCSNKFSNESGNSNSNNFTCTPSEDSDQPGHPRSLIRVFASCMKVVWAFSYLQEAQHRLQSNCEDVKANLSIRWVHIRSVGNAVPLLK